MSIILCEKHNVQIKWDSDKQDSCPMCDAVAPPQGNRLDAMRYRWLRDRNRLGRFQVLAWNQMTPQTGKYEYICGDDLDTAIDAGMSEEGAARG